MSHNRTVQSSPPLARRPVLWQNAKLRTQLRCPRKTFVHLLRLMSHNRISPSLPPDASSPLACPENATLLTQFECPFSVQMNRFLGASQSFTCLSAPPEAIKFPSCDHATVKQIFLCDIRTPIHLKVFKSQIRTVRSPLLEASSQDSRG